MFALIDCVSKGLVILLNLEPTQLAYFTTLLPFPACKPWRRLHLCHQGLTRGPNQQFYAQIPTLYHGLVHTSFRFSYLLCSIKSDYFKRHSPVSVHFPFTLLSSGQHPAPVFHKGAHPFFGTTITLLPKPGRPETVQPSTESYIVETFRQPQAWPRQNIYLIIHPV